ncbi:MAG: hypothetical protein KAJ23_07550 [Maribacter sp.]|nr:hypothetical protein [Maribacter sp.]
MKDNSRLKQYLEDAWIQRRESECEETQNLVKEAQKLWADNDYNSVVTLSSFAKNL